MKISVIQPPYFMGDTPDKSIGEFLLRELELATEGSLTVLPEYSNAGGLSNPQKELAALPRAKEMLDSASRVAKEKSCYVATNVLEERNAKIYNSTYLFDKTGGVAFTYNKIHLPPSEVSLGVEYGDGECICDLNGIRFAFMTCYDVYFNEQIEYIASKKPDVIIIPGYQRGEDTEIIRAQTRLIAFRCNSYVAKSSYSMNDDSHGGCSMIVSPRGEILTDLGKDIGSASVEIDPHFKHTRSAGFGGDVVRNDDFINEGLRPEVFR